MDLGEGEHKGELSFSLHYIKGICYQYDLLLMMSVPYFLDAHILGSP